MDDVTGNVLLGMIGAIGTLATVVLVLARVVSKTGDLSKVVAEGQAPVAQALNNLEKSVRDGEQETKAIGKKLDDLSGDHDAIVATKATVERIESKIA